MNWSLVLNVVLLTGVMFAIGRLFALRNQIINRAGATDGVPQTAQSHEPADDIIAVRKIESTTASPPVPAVYPKVPPKSRKKSTDEKMPTVTSSSLLIFLLAKENRQLAGYELLQTILAAGLRFGEGQLFHRHQNVSGQGPVLCSLATATPSGVFDLQNIGGFSVHGLCLFMQTSGAATIDSERFSVMLETAKQLSDGLDAHLLDDQRKPWSEISEQRYMARLQVEELA